MLEKAIAKGDQNKIVPGWLRAVYVIPCLAVAVFLMVQMGNVYMYIAEIGADLFDGSYYVILTFLLMCLVYLVVLLLSLIPAFILITVTRKIMERKALQNQNAAGRQRSETVVSDRNKYN